MLSVYVVLSGFLWSEPLRPDAICNLSTTFLIVCNFFPALLYPSGCTFKVISHFLFSKLRRIDYNPKISSVYIWMNGGDNHSLGVFFWIVCIYVLYSCLLESLAFSPFHLFPDSLSAASHSALYCWKPVSLRGCRLAWKHKRGVGVVAAERDGCNNPCGGSTHVLNYCHKCSPIMLRQAHLEPRLAFFFSRYIIAPWPRASNN